jgi:hypothetical protein
MADDAPNVNLSSGLPETVLPPPPVAAMARIEAAGNDRAALASVAADYPRLSEAWAALGDVAAAAGDSIEAYAYFRVGYHRGLDALRQSGWRGTGYVRWDPPSNRGFLRSLEGLRRQAEVIGEQDEAVRCAEFLRQLDPGRDRA